MNRLLARVRGAALRPEGVKMAKTITSFKKGQCGNLNGRPVLSEQERQVREASRVAIAEACLIVHGKTVQELEEIVNDKTEMAITVIMASAIIQACKYGDWSKYDKILDRILGKSKESVDPYTEPKGAVSIEWFLQKFHNKGKQPEESDSQ